MDKNQEMRFGVLMAAFLLACLLVVQVLLGMLAWDIGARYEGGNPALSGIVIVLATTLISGVMLAYHRLSWRNAFHASPYHPLSAVLISALPLLVTLLGALFLIQKATNFLFWAVPAIHQEVEMLLRLAGGGVASWITIVVIAPVFEELFFRGILLRGLLGRYGPWTAIALSSALFAVAHLTVSQLLVAFALGALNGWLYVRTRSLLPCIFSHATYNFFVMIYFVLTTTDADTTSIEPFFHPILVDFIAIGLVVVGLRGLRAVLRGEARANKQDGTSIE